MRSFLAGVLVTLMIVVGGGLAALWSWGSPGSTASPERGAPLPRVRADETRLAALRADGRDLRLSPRGLAAKQLRLDATLAYDVAAAQIGQGVRLAHDTADQVRVERTVSALGRSLEVTATGPVRAEDGQLVVEPETVGITNAPPALNSALSAIARRAVTIRHSVAGVPPGFRLERVRATPDGLAVRLEGRDVRLGR